MPDKIIATDYDPDFSHAMLVVVVKLGGSIELDATDLAPDAMGDAKGVLYRMALGPLPGQRLRLSVVPTAADTQQQ